jgi:hypothetical protein
MSWSEAIALNRALISKGQTELAVIVSGNSVDSEFWARTVDNVKRDTLREDGQVRIESLAEEQPLGNFLGTVNAWAGLKRRVSPPTRGVALLNMVFGKGKRFSPFTQALGNRKAAFPTPLRARHSGAYLRTGDLATLYSNSWLDTLRARGFHGILIKWGDEAVIPSLSWETAAQDFSDVDLIRFVWKTEPTEVLAREKEWFLINEESGLIESLIPRQPLSSLIETLAAYQGRRYSTAVNLGSVAVSYRFLELAAQVFGDLLESRAASADWDPYAIFLLLGEVPDAPNVQAGLRQAEARCPGFAHKIADLRSRIHNAMGRPVRMGFLDFGEAFWVDVGLHSTLRRCLHSLTVDDENGRATRAFFDIPDKRDQNGNIVINSHIPAGARITNSVLIDSTIVDSGSVVDRGVVVASRHNRLAMPAGGASLFAAVADLQFEGENGIAFRSVTDTLRIPEGGRHTCLYLEGAPIPMVSNESIKSYEGDEYAKPILSNALSFEEAGVRAGAIDPQQLEDNWKMAWAKGGI